MGASAIDEFLRPHRADLQRKNNSTTFPAKFHIRKIIRLKDPAVRPKEPGFIETDTVAHSGGKNYGIYGFTTTATDLSSGWTEGRTTFGKNAQLIVDKLKDVEVNLPFKLKALYFDNGIEFVNHYMVEQFKEKDLARGRVGKSNDQCHVEQKNSTFVRDLFGQTRIESQEVVDLMNDLFKNEWSQLHNYFLPQMKLISKDQIGKKTHKKYDKPKTPYQRLMESSYLSDEEKESLKNKKSKLNPFHLQAEIQKKLAYIYKKIDEYNESEAKV